MFAKEPPAWLQSWVSFFDDSEAKDQCHFRRRAILALTLGPLGFFLTMGVIRPLWVLTLLLFGRRDVNYKPLVHPFSADTEDIAITLGPSRWWKKESGRSRSVFFRFINPPTLVGALAISWLFWKMGEVPFLAMLILLMGFLLFGGLGTLAILGLKRWYRSLEDAALRMEFGRHQREEREKLSEGERRRRAEFFELETLACNGLREARLAALPREKRTVYLRFQELKARVCRPYAH
jgi:hypothetical protein